MNKGVPSERMALNLLRKTGCSRKVVEHCVRVSQFAVQIAKSCRKKGIDVNVEMVRIGALLHDIGRARTHTVDHGIIGAQIARELRLPNSLVKIIENHVGSGIDENEARKLGWPIKSYIPESLEERIVAYADKLIAGTIRMPINAALDRLGRGDRIPETALERLRLWHKEFLDCMK